MVVHGSSTCFVSIHYFDYHVSLNLANILHKFCVSQWSSSIVLLSGYLVSLIDFPTNWRTITMWFSMDADIVSSVSIIFDYHVSLNLADILHNFCVSYCSSSLVLHTFQSISHHWLIPYKLESHYHVVVHGCSNCFVSVHYFDYHVSLNLANILHNFCVSQWSSSIVFHNFQSISHHWFISLQIGLSLTCGCPWKQYLFRQYPLFRLSCVPKSC